MFHNSGHYNRQSNIKTGVYLHKVTYLSLRMDLLEGMDWQKNWSKCYLESTVFRNLGLSTFSHGSIPSQPTSYLPFCICAFIILS